MMSLEHAQLAKKLGYRCDDQGKQKIEWGDFYYDEQARLVLSISINTLSFDDCVLIPTMRGLWDWAVELGAEYEVLKFYIEHEGEFGRITCADNSGRLTTADTPECALLYLIKEILG